MSNKTNKSNTLPTPTTTPTTTAPKAKTLKVEAPKVEVQTEVIDLAKVDTPDLDSLSNLELLNTIIQLSAARAKENPKAPHVGVNELAAYLSQETAHKVDGKTIRRKLQKIRKKGESYEQGKTGEVIIPANTTANPLDAPITIQWVNRDDRAKGIEYLVTTSVNKDKK